MDNLTERETHLCFDENTLGFTFQKGEGCLWKWKKDYKPYMECQNGTVYFCDAQEITHEPFHAGVGKGVLSTYCGFKKEGKTVPYKFQTLVWTEAATGEVYCEWIPVCEEGLEVKKVCWPGPVEFEEKREDW